MASLAQLHDQLFKHVPSEHAAELEAELERLIAQRRGCIDASRRAVLNSMARGEVRPDEAGTSKRTDDDNDNDDDDDGLSDAGIVEDVDEGVHDLEKFGGGGAGASRSARTSARGSADGGGNAVRARSARATDGVDASLYNLLLAPRDRDDASIQSLRQRRRRNSAAVLSLPSPREPAFGDRRLMAELGSVSLKQFADVDANLVRVQPPSRSSSSSESLVGAVSATGGESDVSPVDSAHRVRRALTVATPPAQSYNRVGTKATSVDDAAIEIEDRDALREVAVEWYRYVLGIVKKTKNAIGGSQSAATPRTATDSPDLLEWLHACRMQIQHIEARLESLEAAGGATQSARDADSSDVRVDPRSIVNASDMLFMARAMTYKHQVSLPVHRLLTRISTMLPTVFSTPIFSDATDAVACAYNENGGVGAGTSGSVGGPPSPVSEFATPARAATPDNGRGTGVGVSLGGMMGGNSNSHAPVSLQAHALSAVLESEESLYTELNSLTLKLTNRRTDYETPNFSVKLLFEQRFARHVTLARIARKEGHGQPEKPITLADDEAGPMDAADVNSDRRFAIAGLILTGTDGSHADGLDNVDVVESHPDVEHLLPPSDSGWLDVGIADDVRDPLLRDDVVEAEQRFLQLTNCDTVRGRLSELAKDSFKRSGVTKAAMSTERLGEYRPMSPATRSVQVARSSSSTPAAATPMTVSRAATPLVQTRGTRAHSAATSADIFARTPTPASDAPMMTDFVNAGPSTADRDPLQNRIDDLFMLRFTWLRELRYRLFWNVNAQSAMLSSIASDESMPVVIERRECGASEDGLVTNGGGGDASSEQPLGIASLTGEDAPIVRPATALASPSASSFSSSSGGEIAGHFHRKQRKMLLFDGSFEKSAGIDNRVVNVASFIIRRWRQSEDYTAPDRISLLQELYELELALNRGRTRLMEAYFFIYNRTSDACGAAEGSVSGRQQTLQEIVSVAHRDPVISSDSLDDCAPGVSGSHGLVHSYNLLMNSFDDEYAMVVGVINLAIVRECGIRNRIHAPGSTPGASSGGGGERRAKAAKASLWSSEGGDKHGVPPPVFTMPEAVLHVAGNSISANTVNDASINDVYDSLALLSSLPGALRDVTKRIKNNYCNEIEKSGHGTAGDGGDGQQGGGSSGSKLLSVAIHRMVVKWALSQWANMQRDEVSFQRQECATYRQPLASAATARPARKMPLLFPELRGEDVCFDCVTLERLLRSTGAFAWTVDKVTREPTSAGALKDCLKVLYFSSFRINLVNAKYESNVLTATYAAMARSIGIRVHDVVMPPLDFENMRLTPSSFQALEEDRGDFEELDVNASLRSYLSDDAKASRAQPELGGGGGSSGGGGGGETGTAASPKGTDTASRNNNSDFAITEWDCNMWSVTMMNSVVDIAKALSASSPCKPKAASAVPTFSPAATATPTPRTRRSTTADSSTGVGILSPREPDPGDDDAVNVNVVNFFSVLARVEQMQFLQVAAYRIAVDHNHLLVLVMEKSVMRKRAALALRQWRRMRHEFLSKTKRRGDAREGDSASEHEHELKLHQHAPEAYQERVKLLHFGVSRQTLLLSKSDRDMLQAKRNKAVSMVGPLWFSPNKLKYKLRGTAMRNYGNAMKKLDADAGDQRAQLAGVGETALAGASLAADLNGCRLKLALFDEFCEKLTTDLRIYSMKTELAFAVRCLNKLIVGAVNVGCTQPFFTTNNHFNYTAPDEEVALKGIESARESSGAGQATAGSGDGCGSSARKLVAEKDTAAENGFHQHRRVTTKSARHALRDASFIFSVSNLDVDGSGIGEGISQLSTSKARHHERRLSTTSLPASARRTLNVDLLALPSKDAAGAAAQKSGSGSEHRGTAAVSSNISLSTKLSSDWLFNGLLSPFEVLSSKNHLPTLKRFLECTTAIVDIAYIVAAFMRVQLPSTTVSANGVSVKHWRRCRSSFDVAQSLSKEQNFELMKHLHGLKQETLRCNLMDKADDGSVTGSAGRHLMRRRSEIVETLLLVLEDAAAKLRLRHHGHVHDHSRHREHGVADPRLSKPKNIGGCVSSDCYAARYIEQLCANIAGRKPFIRDGPAVVSPATLFSATTSQCPPPQNMYTSLQLHATQKLYDTVDYDALCLVQLTEGQRRIVSDCRHEHLGNMVALVQETNVDAIDRVDQCMDLSAYYATASRLRIKLRATLCAENGERADADAVSRVADGIAAGSSHPSLVLSPAAQMGVATIGKGTMELRRSEAEVHILKSRLDSLWLESDVRQLRHNVLQFFGHDGQRTGAHAGEDADGSGADNVFKACARATFRSDTTMLLRSSLAALSGVVDSSRSIASGGGGSSGSEAVKSGTVLVSTDLLLDWILRVVSGVHSVFDKEMSVQESMHRSSMDKMYETMNTRVIESAAAISQCEHELESLSVTKELDVARSCTSLLIEMEDLKRMLALKDEEFAEQRMSIEHQEQQRYAEEITDLKKQVKALQYHGQLRNEQVQEQMITVLHDLRQEATMRFAERAERATGEVSSLRTTMEAEEHIIELQDELSLLRQSLLQSRTLHTIQLLSRESKYTNDIKMEQQLTKKAQRELHDTRDQYVMRNSMLAGELHSTRLALIKSQTSLSELKMTIANLEKRRDRLLKWKVEHSRKTSSHATRGGASRDTVLVDNDDNDSSDGERDSRASKPVSATFGSTTGRLRRASASHDAASNASRALASSLRMSPSHNNAHTARKRPSTAPPPKRTGRSAAAARHEQVYAASGVDGRSRTYERLSELRHLESRLSKEKDKNVELTQKLEKALAGTHAEVPDTVTRTINNKLHDGLKKTFCGANARAGPTAANEYLLNMLLSGTELPVASSAAVPAALARRAGASALASARKKRPVSALPNSHV